MEFIENIKRTIALWDEKEFYTYVGGFFLALVFIILGSLYYKHTGITFWRKRINSINEEREFIRNILNKEQRVSGQRAEVNAMLTETPDFKIDGFFTELMGKFGFEGNRKPTTSVSFADRGDPEYREVLLNAKFDALDMKRLCELLDELEQNKRIYTKELEIVKSKRNPSTIDVNLTIGTLQRKPEQTETTE